MTASARILTPTEAAETLGVRTAVVIQAMYEKRLPRVRLDDDGTLGIPVASLEGFRPLADEFGFTGERFGEPSIKRGQAASPAGGKSGQIGIGDVPMSCDMPKADSRVRDVIGPKVAPWRVVEAGQNAHCGGVAFARAYEEPN